ncbi:MAG: hypothetical protein IJ783_00550, partial [Kiritimatiellae bacterium]|nr:hypothetical protein [Kiritimatiellia bacterium]
ILCETLRRSGIPPEDGTTIVLMLSKSEDAMGDLAIWILDNDVKSESAILEKAMELHNALPPEQRTAKAVEPPPGA